MAAALGMASMALAGDSEDFSGCDGRMKPKSKDDGMRGEAALTGYSYFGAAMGNAPGVKIEACNRALANPKLQPTQTLRRAHLLRARAASFLEQGKTAEALADLDAAESATADRAADRFFQRSMGASMMLMRAIAHAQTGDHARAAELAQVAAALRPYAVQVQMAAALIRQAARPVGKASESPWADLVRLEPQAAGIVATREAEVGNFAEVLAQARVAPIVWPDQGMGVTTFFSGGAVGGPFGSALTRTLQLAYAQAAMGDPAAAKQSVALVRAKIAALDPPPTAAAAPATVSATGTPPAAVTAPAPAATPAAAAGEVPKGPAAPAGAGSQLQQMMASAAEPHLRLAEARIALSEGRESEARRMLSEGKLPLSAATMEFITALRTAPGAPAGPALSGDLLTAIAGDRTRSLGRLGETLLIAPETQRTLIDYQKSRPNILQALVGGALSMGTTLLGGIERTSGFRSAPNPDGTTKVEYVGNTTSGPMVQEMTLLRAAELARAAGKAQFVIVDRKDYSRFLVTSMYGVERSRTPTGYKTELWVRYLDSGEQNAAAFDAVAVIDALGPIYYESKQQNANK